MDHRRYDGGRDRDLPQPGRLIAAFEDIDHLREPHAHSIPVAVIGAGLIGRTHIDRALKQPGLALAGIADPSDEARRLAQSVNVPWFADYAAMMDGVKPRGVVIATPNATHAAIAVQCLQRGAAVLVEKPIADTLMMQAYL